MIVSHRHRYLFVEVPNTASTAISRELRHLYDGEPRLHKHATYAEFLKTATADEQRYFVFCGVRHPLDIAVTEYFKLKTNHRGRFTEAERPGNHSVVTQHRERFHFVAEQNPEFAEFFGRFRTTVYTNQYLTLHQRFDYVMRYERLQEDFSEVLRLLGITQKQPLPTHNQTQEKQRDFWQYYPPHTRRQAVRLFAPFMEEWGYGFPEDWGTSRSSLSSRLRYRSVTGLARLLAVTLRVGPNSKSPALQAAREILRRVWS